MKKLFMLKLAFVVLIGSAAGQSKVDLFANAIAKAEGYYVHGTIPNRCHNPGDLKAAYHMTYPGQVGVCKGGHIRFRRDADGWAALHHQIEKALDGESHFYNPNMTFFEVAKRYAGNYRVWLKNVTHQLGVSADTTLAEFFELGRPNFVQQDEPRLNFTMFDINALLRGSAIAQNDFSLDTETILQGAL